MSYKEDIKDTAHVTTVFGFGVWVFTLLVVPLFLGLGYLSYLAYSFYAPRYEQVRYNTFKESQAYNDGMLRDLQNLRMDYLKADKEQKAALRAITLHRFSVYDAEKLPADLRQFYAALQRGE